MKNKRNNELAVCGFAAVKKLEKNHPEKIKRLYFTSDVAPKFGGLCRKLAKDHGIYNQKHAEDLEKLCGSVHHQGVVAMIEPPEIIPLDSDITENWIENGENAVLLDRIGNANNFGAIVRSAAFFGIKNIIIPLDEAQSSITTSSYRVAEGGMEYVNVYSVQSPERLLKAVKGKMISIGTSLEARKTISEFNYRRIKKSEKKPLLIILGNEENGISDEVKNNCDELIIIPWGNYENGQKESLVDSLNVAQASSIIFYEIVCCPERF
ncbi:MAG: RNA methyltransferase [Spirochaetales bacterium]|nr:RNA methyltransferase [Spirochaetales bacterium]